MAVRIKPNPTHCKHCGNEIRSKQFKSVCSSECAQARFPHIARGKRDPKVDEGPLLAMTPVNQWLTKAWRLVA